MASTSYQKALGWEIFYVQIEKDLKEKSDIIIALIHWILIFQKQFKCIQQENNNCENINNILSELLPNGWNEHELYTLHYCKNNKKFVLSSTRSSNKMNITFMDVEKKIISNCDIDADEVVSSIKGHFDTIIPNINEIIFKLTTELIENIIGSEKESKSTTISPSVDMLRQHQQSRADPHLFRFGNSMRNSLISSLPMRNIGGNDLNPFGISNGGGMLFSPSRSDTVLHQNSDHHLPRPRFDDFNPMGISDPDNDHQGPSRVRSFDSFGRKF